MDFAIKALFHCKKKLEQENVFFLIQVFTILKYVMAGGRARVLLTVHPSLLTCVNLSINAASWRVPGRGQGIQQDII